MLSSSLVYGLSTLLLSSTISPVSAFWRLLCDNPVTIGRYDPIVSPGAIAGHVHTISGGSGFGMSTSYSAMRNASCTSCQIQQDLSNYWIPQLYYQNPNNGSFEDVGTIGGMTVYYLQRGDNVKAFPPGFQMLAGNPNLRSYTDVLEQQAINFVCLDYSAGSSSSTGLPTKNCPQGLRAQVVFPSCWNGKDLDSSNHKSHMAYPDQISSGNCPVGFPIRLVTIFYEVTFTVDDFGSRWYAGRDQPFVFSQGDPTGYGLHGDFVNGWEQSFLQSAIDTCTNASGLEQDCPLFNLAYGQNCHVTPQINEVVSGSLPKLPGCNPVQFGPAAATAQTCINNTVPQVWNSTIQYLGNTAPPQSNFLANQAQTKKNYSSWQFLGCYSDGNSRTMSTHVSVSGNFTVETCLDSCSTNGYQYGAMENGNECWCSNTAPSQTTANLLTYASCSSTCTGNSMELCGGGWALSVYNDTSVVAPTIPLKSSDLTASYLGCFTDNANRIMPIALGSTNGTVDGCVSACQVAGFPYSGVEYMGQCYCSSSLPSSSLKASDADCSMKCSGDKTKLCGGGYRLQVYSGPVATNTVTKKVQALPYAGCFTDGGSRSLSNQVSSNKTIEGCIASCTSSGYKIAGLEYGGECWCDNVVSASMAVAPESDCNMPCTGNQLEICGAGNRLSVYNGTALVPVSIQTNVGGLQYAGCYTDDGNRVMKSATPKNQTVAGCVATCQSLGYSQAGVEYGGECYCGPLAARSTKVADTDCSMTCNGDRAHLCGAGYRLQLYNTTTIQQSSSSISASVSAASLSVSASSIRASSMAKSVIASTSVAISSSSPAKSSAQVTTTNTAPPAIAAARVQQQSTSLSISTSTSSTVSTSSTAASPTQSAVTSNTSITSSSSSRSSATSSTTLASSTIARSSIMSSTTTLTTTSKTVSTVASSTIQSSSTSGSSSSSFIASSSSSSSSSSSRASTTAAGRPSFNAPSS